VEKTLHYLIGLRLRMRSETELRAAIDRCIRLASEAMAGDAASLDRLDAETRRLAAQLERRFGRRRLVRH
jgi:hypothetical protein